MLCLSFRALLTCCKKTARKELKQSNLLNTRNVHFNFIQFCEHKSNTGKDEILVQNFETIANKNKNSYLDMVKLFLNRDVRRRGHVEFIYSALKSMEVFDVHKDLEVYKALVDVLPKGKFIPQNVIQAEFMHYPKQQQCIIDLLEQMEDNGVMPDIEMENILLNTFGRRGYPLRKFWRMMYWMPKFKNLSPWPLPNPLPNDAFELAKLAIARIGNVDVQSNVTIYQSSDLPDDVENTWIISSQSPTQRRLLQERNRNEPVYVEGPFKVWLRSNTVNYFILRANSKPPPVEEDDDPDDVSRIKFPSFNFTPMQKKTLANIPSIHEQEDGVIMAISATGTSSKNSALSWVRHLEKEGNPILTDIPVVFTLRTAQNEIDQMASDVNGEIQNH